MKRLASDDSNLLVIGASFNETFAMNATGHALTLTFVSRLDWATDEFIRNLPADYSSLMIVV